MKNTLKIIITSVLFLSLIILNSTAALANTPEGAVYEAINKIKSKGNLTPLVESVDWKGAYEALPKIEREAMKIKSADDMKTYFKKEAESGPEDSVNKLKETFKKEKKVGESPEEKAKRQEALRTIDKELQNQKNNLSKMISRTNYKVLGSTIEGDSAKVKVLKTFEGDAKEIELDLKKVDGTWKLVSAGPLNPMSLNSGGAGNPLGTIQSPVHVLSQP